VPVRVSEIVNVLDLRSFFRVRVINHSLNQVVGLFLTSSLIKAATVSRYLKLPSTNRVVYSMIFRMSRVSPITNLRGKTLYMDDASRNSLLARVLVLADGCHPRRLRFWTIPVRHSCLFYHCLREDISNNILLLLL